MTCLVHTEADPQCSTDSTCNLISMQSNINQQMELKLSNWPQRPETRRARYFKGTRSTLSSGCRAAKCTRCLLQIEIHQFWKNLKLSVTKVELKRDWLLQQDNYPKQTKQSALICSQKDELKAFGEAPHSSHSNFTDNRKHAESQLASCCDICQLPNLTA